MATDNKPKLDRNKRIKKLISNGRSMRDVANDFGLAVSRVHEIARREGNGDRQGKAGFKKKKKK
jgi:hypothetical protein